MYNPNSKYGRRKNREQAQRNINNYNDKEKVQYNLFMGCTTIILLLIFALITFIKVSNK